MTIFSDNPHDRRMERLMMTVPNFAPRGVGFRFTEAQLFITTTAATPTEILTATMRQIRCPPFRKRFNEYIESEEKPMTYDGQTFPPYLYDPGVLCVAKAEYGGKTEYLYFPCEEEAIDKAFARLGTTADEVKITLEDFNTDSPEWFGRFREIAAEEGVYELNRLTGAVNTADMDLKKLWSVAEYAEAEDAEQLTRLARNIGCFTFIEGATGYAEVGRFFTETEDRYILDLEMEDYFDYEGFGEYISDKFYGKFVCGGFIYNDTDTSLLDILYQDEPMTMGGM